MAENYLRDYFRKVQGQSGHKRVKTENFQLSISVKLVEVKDNLGHF